MPKQDGTSVFLISVKLKERSLTGQVKEELAIRHSIARQLNLEGYKFVLCDQDCIKQEVLDKMEEVE